MSTRKWCIVLMALTAVLLAGCGGGGETPVADTPTQVSPTTAATVLPTEPHAPEGPQATVVDVINDVDADPLAEGEWRDALVDMVIYVNGQVWSQESSTARVAVEEGLVRVAPNTIFTFEQLDSETLQLTLDEGQVWVNVEGLEPGQTFQVETPAAVASVRGTRFSARVDPAGATIVSTQVGTVMVSAAGSAVDVTGGSQTTVSPGDSPDHPEPMSPEEQVRWGMAAGAGLDAYLPAIGDPGVLTYTTGYVFSRDWSHEGRYFAFTYYDLTTGGLNHAIYDAVVGTAITSSLPQDTSGIFFNPVKEVLAYQHDAAMGTEICIASIEGVTRACFGGDAVYGWPFWSPDGNSIVLYSDVREMAGKVSGHMSPRSLTASARQTDDVVFNLFKFSPDGSDRAQLTFAEEGNNIRQAWSPDGERIAYVYALEYSGPGDVWVMDADGSNPQLLFEDAYANGYDHLVWSPDGSLLAVPKEGGGLWLVPADGSDPWLGPGTEGWECWNPVWSPTDDGWPLFFYGYAPEKDLQMLWYLPEMGEEPGSLGYADWGPTWPADGSRLAIDFTDMSGDVPETEVYFFEAEPDFWP